MTLTKSIKVRLTDAEHQTIKAKAGAQGISTFVRIRVLGADQRHDQKERLLILAELSRARTILNHIAQNSLSRPPVEQVHIMTQLCSLERELSKLNH